MVEDHKIYFVCFVSRVLLNGNTSNGIYIIFLIVVVTSWIFYYIKLNKLKEIIFNIIKMFKKN